MSEHRRIDPRERAHLRDDAGFSPEIFRYLPAPDLAGLVRRHWIPVWSLFDGVSSVQRVLQYPVCLVVVAGGVQEYAALVGPTTGLGRQELSGSGWAFGAMLQPAAGQPLLGRPVAELTDSRVRLADVPGLDGRALAGAVRDAIAPDPTSERGHRRAIEALEAALRGLLPIDAEGALANRIVEHIEEDSSVLRVGQICAEFGLSERALQRLTARRLGLSPKWLVQRRRLHEAAERLRAGDRPDLAGVAAELGYADQAHFTRDFRTVTGLTPGAFAAEPGDR